MQWWPPPSWIGCCITATSSPSGARAIACGPSVAQAWSNPILRPSSSSWRNRKRDKFYVSPGGQFLVSLNTAQCPLKSGGHYRKHPGWLETGLPGACVEHPFRVIKCQFGFTQVRYHLMATAGQVRQKWAQMAKKLGFQGRNRPDFGLFLRKFSA